MGKRQQCFFVETTQVGVCFVFTWVIYEAMKDILCPFPYVYDNRKCEADSKYVISLGSSLHYAFPVSA